MDSTLWDVRTVLDSTAQEDSRIWEDDNSDEQPPIPNLTPKPGPVDIWNYLVKLTEDKSRTDYLPKPGQIRHFQAADFERSWDDVPTQIGSGASYSVEKCSLHRKAPDGSTMVVAVKRLNFFKESRRDPGMSEAALQRSVGTVLKELRILTHLFLAYRRNIVTLLGYRFDFVGAHGHDGLYQRSTDLSLVMDFAEHGTLEDFLRKLDAEGNRPSLLVKAQLMRDVAAGLEALHGCSIAHGDVKMENTLVFAGVRSPLIVKLSDFGHALVDLQEDSNQNQRYLGTPLFNAPELRPRDDVDSQTSRPVVGADAFYKCDIYSYGLLVWEVLLNGQRFCKALGDPSSYEDIHAVISYLSQLPKDELFLKALATLQKQSNMEDKGLLQVLNRVLRTTLRDNPDDRKPIIEIIKVFREYHDLNDKVDKGKGISSTELGFMPLFPMKKDDQTLLQRGQPVPRMPPTVQADLVAQLKLVSDLGATQAERHAALYDLAICAFGGFGSESADLDKGLELLNDAARHGSPEGMALVIRLHDALGRQVPQDVRDLAHPVVEIESRLSKTDDQDYFSNRIREFERLYQREAMTSSYDIFINDELLMTEVSLLDLESLLIAEMGFTLENIRCKPSVEILSFPWITEALCFEAARLGLLSLLKYLYDTFPQNPKKASSRGLLNAACRGGHLEVVKFLLSKGLKPSQHRHGSPFHWLVMFPLEEARTVLDLLLQESGGYHALTVQLQMPYVGMQPCTLLVTPLEFAIALNDGPLVELLLGVKDNANDAEKKDLENLGWTDTTLRLAVSLNLSNLLPTLIPHEIEYRRAKPEFAAAARYNMFKGLPELISFGLSDIAYPPHPMLPLLIHGKSCSEAIGDTIDAITQSGICSINDEDANGYTALTHAVRSAPCDFNDSIIRSLISRGAKFGKDDTNFKVLVNMVIRRRSHAETVAKTLLETGLLTLDVELLVGAVQLGKKSLVEAILTFEDRGHRLDVNAPFLDDDGDNTEVLFFAVKTPNNSEIVELLLDHGANLDVRYGARSILEVATTLPNCDAATIDLLISRGARLVSDGFSILHHVTCTTSRVNDMHVIFHLLEHEKIKALVDYNGIAISGQPNVTPLYMACFAANLSAIHALLQAGATTTSPPEWPSPGSIAIDVGRRPYTSLVWSGHMSDVEKVYDWRRDMEDIVLVLLGEEDPGNGRTRLHIAVQLGNYRRVKELLGRQRHLVTVKDRDEFIPAAYLEDIESLEIGDDDDDYIQNLQKLAAYLDLKLAEEVSLAGMNAQATDASHAGISGTLGSALEGHSARDDGVEECIGDGLDSPAEREQKLVKQLDIQKQTLGHLNPATLLTMAQLVGVYGSLGRMNECEAIHAELMAGREAQVPRIDADIYDSWMDKISLLCIHSKFQEAIDYGKDLFDKAEKLFGLSHPVTLEVLYKISSVYPYLGEFELALETAERAVNEFANVAMNKDYGVSDPVYGLLNLQSQLVYLYCSNQKSEKAQEVAKGLSAVVESAEPKDFGRYFDCLTDSVCGMFDLFGLYDDAERIYLEMAAICEKKHGKRKSYCTRVVFTKLAAHYRTRGLQEKEAETLQKFVDHLRATMGAEHSETVEHTLALATCLGALERWVEASILQSQIIGVLSQSVGTSDGKTLEVKFSLCKSLRGQKLLEESEKCARQAVEVCKENLGDLHELTLQAMKELALTLVLEDKSDEVIEIQQMRLEALSKVHGEVHLLTWGALEGILCALMRLGKREEAEVQAQKCLDVMLQLPEENGHSHGHCYWLLANCKDRLGKNEEAEKLYLKCLEVEKAHHTDLENGYCKDAIHSFRCLAKLYLESRQLEKAETTLREVLVVAKAFYGTESTDVYLDTTFHLAQTIIQDEARLDEAVAAFELSLDLVRRSHGESAEKTISFMAGLVSAYVASARYEDAQKLCEKVVQFRKKTYGPLDVETMDSKLDLCIIYHRLQMWREAEDIQKSVLAHLEAADEDGSDDICTLWGFVSRACRFQGRYEEAEMFIRKALEYRVRTEGKEGEKAVDMLIDLSYVLLDAEKMTEAKEVADEALNNSKALGVYSTQALYAQSLLATIHQQQGQSEEAIKLQRLVVEKNPENLEELNFLIELCLEQKHYPEALIVSQQAVSAAEASKKMESIIAAMVVLTEVYVAAEHFQKAKDTGERVREMAELWRDPKYYKDTEVFIDVLVVLKSVYEGLVDEEKLYEVEVELEKQRAEKKENRRQHIMDHMFEKKKF